MMLMALRHCTKSLHELPDVPDQLSTFLSEHPERKYYDLKYMEPSYSDRRWVHRYKDRRIGGKD
jgi:hypothetical protein